MGGPATQIDHDTWSKERFLEWVAAQPGDQCYEFDGARPVAMAPATLGHNDIGRNIRDLLRAKLSPVRENRHRDEAEKADEYEAVPSILRYAVFESESRGVRVFWRQPGERAWRREPFDTAGPLELAEFGVQLAFDDIYEGVDFD